MVINDQFITCKVGKQVLCKRAYWAKTWWQRTKGLMFTKSIGQQDDCIDGMLIDHCNSIHTFFMWFPLDLIFLSRDNRVIKVIANKKPWRISGFYWQASKVLELPVGKAVGIYKNDYVEVINV